MYRRWIEAVLLAGLAIGAAGTLSAQQRQLSAPGQPSIMNDADDATPATPPPGKPARTRGQKAAPAFEHDPDLDAADQLAPSQVDQSMPGAVAMPTGGGHTHAAARGTEAVMEPGAIARPARPMKQHVIACSGVFARTRATPSSPWHSTRRTSALHKSMPVPAPR